MRPTNDSFFLLLERRPLCPFRVLLFGSWALGKIFVKEILDWHRTDGHLSGMESEVVDIAVDR